MTATAASEKKDVVVRKTLPDLLKDPAQHKRFEEMLGKDARSFAQNILTVFNTGRALHDCEPNSIIAAASISASINLSILPSLGHSCIVPYKEKDGTVIAQWQIMWKGLVQLAHRSGQYKKIHLARVYEGELVRYDKFRNIIDLDEKRKKSDRVQGYFFYFELITGGEFQFYWSAKECVEHGLRFSKSFQSGQGKWTEDPEFAKAGSVKKWLDGKEHLLTEGSGADAMSAKSIVKNELQTWGPLETRIKETIALDQAAIGGDGKPRYIDTTTVEGEQAAGGAPKKAYEPTPTPSGAEPTATEKIAWAERAAGKQGVSAEQFRAWLAQQEGDDEAKAKAAELAWKRVAAKEAKAVDVFKVDPAKAAAPAQAADDAKGAEQERPVRLGVASTAKTDLEGEPVTVIRDTNEPQRRFYTDADEVVKAAKAAKEDGTEFAAMVTDRTVGGKPILWLTRIA